MVELLGPLNQAASVLEPAGGDGAFVRALLDAGASPSQVHVWDIDPAACARVSDLGVHVTTTDALLHPGSEQFDAIVGNPPYLNKASEYLRAHRAELADAYRNIGANETYAMFTVMGLRRLRPGGRIAFLISDTFLTLGLHEKFRRELLVHQVDEVTLLPEDTFPDASVRTAILVLTKTPAPAGHTVRFNDLRTQKPGQWSGGQVRNVPQSELSANPGATMAFSDDDREALTLVRRCPTKLLDVVDGGLGMYARNNERNVAVVTDSGIPRAPVGQLQLVTAEAVDGNAWRAYHKRGGTSRWWKPAEHAVRWDAQSRTMYDFMPASRCGTHQDGRARTGVILSGISTQLSARMATPGALWESNKCFGLFPKDPVAHPASFILAVLNSATYDRIAKALNHTVSFQVRDLKRLPLLPFTEAEVRALAELGDRAVAAVQNGGPVPRHVQAEVDAFVRCAADRVLRD